MGPDHKVKIDNIIFSQSSVVGEIDIDQRLQPNGYRIKLFPDGHMEFKNSKENGRSYYISKKSYDDRRTTELVIQADCETPKTNS